MFMLRKLYVLEVLRWVQLRFVTLRHVMFTLCSNMLLRLLSRLRPRIRPQAGEGGARPPPFIISTITYEVVVYAPAERADTLRPISPRPLHVLCAL
jgi:hypothetical protein